MDCNCPDDGILKEIPDSNCPFDMKQIQRIAFATKGKVIWDSADGTGGAGNGVPATALNAQIDTKADWTARKTAVDDTKIVFSPRVGGDPQIEAGDAITEGGGDNSTFDGVELVTGTNPSVFSASFKSLLPAQEKALKAIKCKEVEVYFFLQGGRIAYQEIKGEARVKGFQMSSYHFSDRGNAGYGTKDTNTMRFSLPEGWSENLNYITPADFDPIYDI